jgi:hypothetical protein
VNVSKEALPFQTNYRSRGIERENKIHNIELTILWI